MAMVPTPARDHRSQVLGQHILALATIASDEITGVFQMAFLGCSAGFDQRLEAESSSAATPSASMVAYFMLAYLEAQEATVKAVSESSRQWFAPSIASTGILRCKQTKV